jgi:hypothetical protein
MGDCFRFILLQYLHHNRVVAVHSRRRGKRPNTLPAGYRANLFGRWRGRGPREGHVVIGGGCSGGWEAGEDRIWGWIFPAKRGRVVFPTWRAVPTLPIGSCCARAGSGAPTIYLGSNGRRHDFGLAGGAPILAPIPKTVPTEVGRRFGNAGGDALIIRAARHQSIAVLLLHGPLSTQRVGEKAKLAN